MSIIRTILQLYKVALIIDAILSYFPNLQGQNWRIQLKKLCDYTCNPIRKMLPPVLPLDPSPLIVILIINLFEFLW